MYLNRIVWMHRHIRLILTGVLLLGVVVIALADRWGAQDVKMPLSIWPECGLVADLLAAGLLWVRLRRRRDALLSLKGVLQAQPYQAVLAAVFAAWLGAAGGFAVFSLDILAPRFLPALNSGHSAFGLVLTLWWDLLWLTLGLAAALTTTDRLTGEAFFEWLHHQMILHDQGKDSFLSREDRPWWSWR